MLRVRYVDNIPLYCVYEKVCLIQIVREVKKNFPKLLCLRFFFGFFGKNAAKVSATCIAAIIGGRVCFFSPYGGAFSTLVCLSVWRRLGGIGKYPGSSLFDYQFSAFRDFVFNFHGKVAVFSFASV